MPFKIRYEVAGAHVYCTVFYRLRDDLTWQNCGTIVVDDRNGIAEFRAAMRNTEFEKKERDDDFRI